MKLEICKECGACSWQVKGSIKTCDNCGINKPCKAKVKA